MSAPVLSTVMDSLATAANAGTGLQAFGYPPDNVTAPCIAVGYPTDTDWHLTFGADAEGSMTLPVWLLVGVAADGKEIRDRLSGYLAGISGLVTALESTGATVTAAEVARTEIGAVEYQAIKLTVEVYT